MKTFLNAEGLQRAIFNSAIFSSIATDAQGVIQIFNVGAERMLGYAAAEVMNRVTPADLSDPQELIARATALSLEFGAPIAPGFEALVFKASRGIEDIYELTYVRNDGSRFPAMVSVTALRDAGEAIIGYLLIGTDNTARKQAEEALFQAGALQRAIFHSANFSSIATDAQGVIQIFNVGAERMLGYTAAEVMNAVTPADLSDPQELIARATALSVEFGAPITPGFEALVFKASRGIEDIYELTYIRKDGSRFPAMVSVTALRDAGEAIIGYLLIGTDNTARKQTEEARRKSDQFEAAPDAMVVMDVGGVVLDCNRQAEVVFGRGKVDIIGHSAVEFSPFAQPDGRPSTEGAPRHFNAAITGSPERFDWQLSRVDGAVFDAEVNLVRVNIGSQVCLQAVIRDISERKRAEQELHHSLELLDRTGRLAKIGGWQFDVDTQDLDWTDETYRIHDVDHTVRPSVAEAIGFFAPEARPVITAAIRAAIDTGTPWDLELPLITAKGRHIWVRDQGTAERRGGKTIRLHGVFQDITERTRAEQVLLQRERRLSSIYETVADVLFYLEVEKDGRYRFISINQAFVSTTGLEHSQVIGKRVDEVILEPSLTVVLEKYGEAIREKRVTRWEETSEYPKGRLTGEVSVVPVFDDAGHCTHLVGAIHDITERLRLEAQYRQAQKVESVGQLASGIAHDFNNLLTVINGMADLVLGQVSPDDQVYADVQEIHRAGERAATLTRQLLAFSRQQILQPQVMTFDTAVTGMESLLRRLLGEDIDLVIVLTPDAGRIKADPGQLEQVMANLAVNARDAMPRGGHLTIETQNVTVDEDYARQHGVAVPLGPYVMLSVSDSGVGMDAATRARIFEPFFTSKGPGKGTGLGLATVFGIVQQSHGFIWVYSEIGQGTTFKIYLPQVTEAVSPRRAPRPSSSSKITPRSAC
jgi:PAS domain S-box-containing protein